MKYYIGKKYNKYVYLAGLIAAFAVIAVPLYRGKDPLSVIIYGTFILFLLGGQIYIRIKQSKLAIIESTENALIINDVRYSKNEIPWDTIFGVRKNFIVGYRLLTLGGEIPIPITSLTKTDKLKFLNELKKREVSFNLNKEK